MDTIVRKVQPLNSPCPICGQTISWHACEKCNQTGRLEEYPGGFHCDEWRTGRYCNWCGKPLPVDRNTCNDCGGRGWIRDRHDCDPASSAQGFGSFGTRSGATWAGAGRYTGSGRATATKKRPNTGQQTAQGGVDATWIVILVLVIVAITFIPEFRELVKSVLEWLWSLLLLVLARISSQS
jgi:hypothetical protein